MGLFDKLKSAIKSEAKEEVIEREDLSGATIMDLLEKVDQYVNEYKDNVNKATFVKLETAMLELANRMPSIPLAKRNHCRPYTDGYKSYLKNYEDALKLGPAGATMVNAQSSALLLIISGMASALAE